MAWGTPKAPAAAPPLQKSWIRHWFYANAQLPHISLISAKCTHRTFFPHKLAFATAILILFVLLLPISVTFRYLDHLATNNWHHPRDWVVDFKQLCTIFRRIFGVYAVYILF